MRIVESVDFVDIAEQGIKQQAIKNGQVSLPVPRLEL